MIALHSVVLPMPLRPMIETGSWPISKTTPCEHVRAAVVDVEVLDRQQRPAFGAGAGVMASTSIPSSVTRPPR